jgi:hypothetical protein
LFALTPAVPEPSLDPESEAVLEQLRNADPNDMTPMEALSLVAALKSTLLTTSGH